jgi:hypothetical protein
VSVLSLTTATTLFAHDLFLLPEAFFVAPESSVNVRVLNGTFEKSEGAVAAARIGGLSVVTPRERIVTPRDGWRAIGDTAVFSVRVGQSGNYLIGLSTLAAKFGSKPRISTNISQRRVARNSVAEEKNRRRYIARRERYSKHVKALLQVGATRSVGPGDQHRRGQHDGKLA